MRRRSNSSDEHFERDLRCNKDSRLHQGIERERSDMLRASYARFVPDSNLEVRACKTHVISLKTRQAEKKFQNFFGVFFSPRFCV